MIKFISGMIGGSFVAMVGVVHITLLFSNMIQNNANKDDIILYLFLILWVITMIIAILTSSAIKVWRRFIITTALLIIFMPISTTISFIPLSDIPLKDGDLAFLTALTTSASVAFITFLPGVLLLIVGLLIGRDKPIIVIKDNIYLSDITL